MNFSNTWAATCIASVLKLMFMVVGLDCMMSLRFQIQWIALQLNEDRHIQNNVVKQHQSKASPCKILISI